MSQPISSFTLGTARRRLASLGILATREELQAIRTSGAADRLRLALERADTDIDARTFLCEAIARIRDTPTASLFAPFGKHSAARPIASGIAVPGPLTLRPCPRSEIIPDFNKLGAGANRESFHVYGASAALTLSAGRNRSGEAVVFIDAAAATASRTFAWSDKLTVMLSLDEMIAALAVATGAVAQAQFRHHGDARDKWLEIHHQGPNLFVKVGQAKMVHAVPVSPADTFKLAALLTSQIKAHLPEGARTEVANLIRSTAAPMLHAAEASSARTYHQTRSMNPLSRSPARRVAIPATAQ